MDVDGDALIATAVTNVPTPNGGTITIAADGSYTYTPAVDYFGSDTYTYTVCENRPNGECTTGTLKITINSINDAPVAGNVTNDAISSSAGPTAIKPLSGTDIDGTILSYTISALPIAVQGQLLLAGVPVTAGQVIPAAQAAQLQFDPDPAFIGDAQFTYTATDNDGAISSSPATFIIPVSNTAPVAKDIQHDPISGNAGATPLNSLTVTDADGAVVSYTIQTVPAAAQGSLTLNGNPVQAGQVLTPAEAAQLVFTPNPSFTGNVTFTFAATDDRAATGAAATYTIPVMSFTQIGVAKSAGPVIHNMDNSYSITYTLTVKNLGTATLQDVQVTDDLKTVFASPVQFTVAKGKTSATGSLLVNADFDGSTDSRLLTAGSTLAAGQTGTITFTVSVTANGAFGPFNNSATAAANSIGGPTTDTSNSGSDPDPDGDLNPNEPENDQATVVALTPHTALGIAKAVVSSVLEVNGSYRVRYAMKVKNLGNVALTNVQVTDDLKPVFEGAEDFKVIPDSTQATGTLKANTSFDGYSDIQLLQSPSTLAVGDSANIYFTVRVAGAGTFSNVAQGKATGTVKDPATDATPTTTTLSHNGTNPDPDGNHVQDAGEQAPTLITLERMEVFVPEGFSPNGDGINDRFVMEGTVGLTVHLEVYNRWGNVVYKNKNYQNDWAGICNQGIAMGEQLPDGTYYYIVKLSNGKSIVKYLTIHR